MKRLVLALAAAAAAFSSPALAKGSAVTDCPLRDAPFSAASPVIDLLLSPAAKAVINEGKGDMFAKAPPSFMGTEPPTFAAILTLKEAARFTGMSADKIAALDTELRKLPVTDADRVARCKRYDNDTPKLAKSKGRPRLLMFEKINGFKDVPSVNAAHEALVAMAARKGWALTITDKGGAFTPATLRKFDAVIWNNISGDVLTLSQRSAFQRYLENGGGYFAMHGSAGDPVYFWDWYVDKLLGARFMGHPMGPQFQEARIAVNQQHPLAASLPAEWRMTDEWYSFRTNPRSVGANVLLTIDESTYKPDGMGQNLRMGDHPLAWTNCIGKGRMFYSAIGHKPETYTQPQHVAMLESALQWVASDRKACAAK